MFDRVKYKEFAKKQTAIPAYIGSLGVFTDMGFGTGSVIGVILVCVILPAILSLIFSEIMRKLGWIKPGDMKLDL